MQEYRIRDKSLEPPDSLVGQKDAMVAFELQQFFSRGSAALGQLGLIRVQSSLGSAKWLELSFSAYGYLELL